ncbi:MAG: hypothetical protein GDA42_13110 [Ekhidna sp.]|nr:hypothetical protein [Ekhidna sp.]
MDSTFAITKAEFYYNSFPLLSIEDRNREYLNFSVAYELLDQSWRFKKSTYHTAFKKESGLLKLSSEYATTRVRSNYNNIPYIKRLQYRDILLEVSKEHDPNFWHNYDIILPDEGIENLFKKENQIQTGSNGNPAKSKRAKLFSILSKFKFRICC